MSRWVRNKCEGLWGWWGDWKWEKVKSDELYKSGEMYEGGVGDYGGRGKGRLVDVGMKNGELVWKVLGGGEGEKDVGWGDGMVEMGLCKLYKVRGEKK